MSTGAFGAAWRHRLGPNGWQSSPRRRVILGVDERPTKRCAHAAASETTRLVRPLTLEAHIDRKGGRPRCSVVTRAIIGKHHVGRHMVVTYGKLTTSGIQPAVTLDTREPPCILALEVGAVAPAQDLDRDGVQTSNCVTYSAYKRESDQLAMSVADEAEGWASPPAPHALQRRASVTSNSHGSLPSCE